MENTGRNCEEDFLMSEREEYMKLCGILDYNDQEESHHTQEHQQYDNMDNIRKICDKDSISAESQSRLKENADLCKLMLQREENRMLRRALDHNYQEESHYTQEHQKNDIMDNAGKNGEEDPISAESQPRLMENANLHELHPKKENKVLCKTLKNCKQRILARLPSACSKRDTNGKDEDNLPDISLTSSLEDNATL